MEREEAQPTYRNPQDTTGLGPEGYRIDEKVEYFSRRAQVWIAARVLGYSARKGLYQLDVQPNASSERIRRR